MNRAIFRRPWVSAGLLSLIGVSGLLLAREFSRSARYVEIVLSDEGRPNLLIEVSFPVLLAASLPFLYLAWRKRESLFACRSDRLFAMTCLTLALGLLYWFDGLQIRHAHALAEKRALESADLYWSQGLTMPAVHQLTEALSRNPLQPHLAVRLTWMLARMNRREDARRWLDIVDKMKVPPYLEPALQETRVTLLLR